MENNFKMLKKFILLAALSAAFVSTAADLQPSFPNHALKLDRPDVPAAIPRARDATYPDEDIPFVWDQVAVVRQSTATIHTFRGFDPQSQPVLIDVLPASPVNLNVTGFDGNVGLQSVTTLPKSAGTSDVFQFRAIARGISSDLANFTYDIRDTTSNIRSAPLVARSSGSVIQPGQIVRYAWTNTSSSVRFPKCEAELSGRTGPAKGLVTSKITQVLAIKAQPFVLGHYLMLVTPREVRGQPALGSTGNGQVFLCAFGSVNLPPVTDGFSADTFLPQVNQSITLLPNAIDPETARNKFNNEIFEFGDGSVLSGVSGAATHAYAQPGIYRVRCTVADDQGLTATAEDSVIVGATSLPTIGFKVVKQIPPFEAGSGTIGDDTLSATFKDPSGQKAKPGDRIVFVFNRNQFGKTNASDNGDITDIILKAGGTFTGKTRLAKIFTVTAGGGGSITLGVSGGQLDRTGDPRLGRCELKGVFIQQRIAVAIIPADGSTPRALLYNGNLQCVIKGGNTTGGIFIAEEKLTATSTTKAPNPLKQEP